MNVSNSKKFVPNAFCYVSSSFGILLTAFPIALAIYSPNPKFVGWAFFSSISLFFAIMTIYGFVFAFRSKVVISSECVVFRGVFKRREIPFSDIDSVNIWGGHIAIMTKRGKNLAIPAVFGKQYDLLSSIHESMQKE